MIITEREVEYNGIFKEREVFILRRNIIWNGDTKIRYESKHNI
jgi:hypothetical protein